MIRKPAVAGTFYPDDKDVLMKTIDKCFSNLDIGSFEKFSSGNYPINVMVPHAGYQYSGAVAAKSYCEIVRNGFPDVFIILSPNHTGLGSEVSVFNEGVWDTPLGSVNVDDTFANLIISNSDIASSDYSVHLKEHSIEVQLPFLQYFSKDFEIVPITMASQSFSASTDLAKSIFDAAKQIDKSFCVVASTDLSHFNNQQKANTVDGFVLEDIEKMDEFKLYEEVIQYNITMCGYGPVITTIYLSKLQNKHSCQILDYKTSGDITGDYNSVVGYASGIFK